jgi:uncharacterized protein YoaH (UPF0181 family)
MKTSLKTFLLGTLILSNFAFAGSENGGGGTYVLKDGEYVMSDPYFESLGTIKYTSAKQVNLKDLPKGLQKAVETIQEFIFSLNLKVPDLNGPYLLLPKTLENHGLCNEYVPNLINRAEAQVRYGCTNGDVTFLYMDVLPKASLRQQAYAILHERLWTLEKADQQKVVDFIDAVMTLEEEAQLQKDGSTFPLSDMLKKKYTKLLAAAEELGLIETRYLPSFEITEHGGLVQKGCLESESTNNVIGISSQIRCNTVKLTITNSRVLNSMLKNIKSLRNSEIISSQIYSTSPTENEEHTFAKPSYYSEIEETRISSSRIYANIKTLPEAQNIKLENVKMYSKYVELGSNVMMKNFTLERFTERYQPLYIKIGQNTQVEDFVIYGFFNRKEAVHLPPALIFKPETKIIGNIYPDKNRVKVGLKMFVPSNVTFGPVGSFKGGIKTTDSTGNSYIYHVHDYIAF